ADGLIKRRDALRRLSLLGIAAPFAATMLAACSKGNGGASSGAAPSATGGPAPAAAPTPVITFAGPKGRTLQGAWATSEKARGAVLVIHENRGLNDHIRSVAGRFAVTGYSALAIDLLSEEGGTAALGDPGNATAVLGKVAPERFVADMQA